MKPSPLPILLCLLFLYLAGMVRVWIWVLAHLIRRSPVDLPCLLKKPKRVPWGLGTVVLVLTAYLGVNIGVLKGYEWLADSAPRQVKSSPNKHPEPGEKRSQNNLDAAESAELSQVPNQSAVGKRADEASDLSVTEKMFLLTLINEILIVLIPVLIKLTSGSRLSDLGITFVDWRRQVKVGIATALFLAPVTFLIQYLAIQIWSSNHHPVEDMIRGEFSPGIAYLAFLSAVVMAPVVEELLFRCLFQSWLSSLMTDRRDDSESRNLESEIKHLEEFEPSTDVSQDEPGMPAFRSAVKTSSRGPARAIFLTSFLFASVHFGQWPAPIPIFVLSVSLGVVYQRTGSLLASITTHATFNSLSTLLLFLAMSADPKPRTTEERVPLAVQASLESHHADTQSTTSFREY